MSRVQKLENFHILLWLMKDLSWLMFWRELGVFMIIPTLSLAIIIAWQNRDKSCELFHSLAVIFWVIANSIWMIIEFLDLENLRYIPSIPFIIGLALILYYYSSHIVDRKKLLKS